MNKKDLINYIYTPEGKARAPRFRKDLLEKNGFGALLQEIQIQCQEVGLGDASLTDMIRAYCKDQMFAPVCKTCSVPYRLWSNKHQAWAKYCSQACVQNDPEVKAKNFCDDYASLVKKREETMRERYGVSTFSQTDAAKEAFVTRTKEAWADDERKEQRLTARKKSNMEKYGVDAVSKVPEVINKTVETRKANRDRLTEEEREASDDVRIKAYRKKRLSDSAYAKLIDEVYLRDLYVTRDLPITKCADEIGCSPCAVKTSLSVFGIDYVPRIHLNESHAEIELYEFIQSIVPTAIRTYKIGKHLDIFIPERNLGFEFNGVYWHSDAKRHSLYHATKVEHFYSHGIRYIQVWEDDWNLRNDSVKSFIRGILAHQTVPANHSIVEILPNIFDSFISTNHMVDSIDSDIRLGMFVGVELISVIGVNKLSSGVYEISQHVDGGHTESFCYLFDWFLREYAPSTVYGICDLEIDDKRDNHFIRNGFRHFCDISPDFKYYDYRTCSREFKHRIDQNEFNEAGKLHRLLRCYDSGKIKFIWERVDK